MPRARYSVIAILPGRRSEYAAFKRGGTVSENGKALEGKDLFMSVQIDAISKTNAEEKVRLQHPRYAIDSTATLKIDHPEAANAQYQSADREPRV